MADALAQLPEQTKVKSVEKRMGIIIIIIM